MNKLTGFIEMNNIANDSQLSSVKKDLKERLLKWMEQQVDKGQQTEMEALEHQTKGITTTILKSVLLDKVRCANFSK